MAFDTSQLDAGVRDAVEALRAAGRPAAQAGVQVIYDAARINAPQSDKAHVFNIEGRKYGPFLPGNLRDAIYQVFSKSESTESKAVYQVSWNYKKAPYGGMVELGTSRTPSYSFLGKALREKKTAALAAMRERYIQEVTA